MADITAIREAIAQSLTAISGLRTFAYVPDAVPTPAAIVGRPEVDFDTTYRRGTDTIRLPVLILVGRATDRSAQMALDAFFETGVGEIRLIDDAGVYLTTDGGEPFVLNVRAASVKSAIEEDPTLGGVVMSTRVVRAADYGAYTVGGLTLLGAEWTVEVLAAGEA